MRRWAHIIGLTLIVALALGLLVTDFVIALELRTLGAELDEDPLVSVLWKCAMLGFLAVGTLLAAKRPNNPIGWLLLVVPLTFWSPTSETLQLSQARGEPLPSWAVELNWVFHGVSSPSLVLLALFLLLAFPNADLTPLGRRILQIALPVALLLVPVRLLAPGPMDGAGIPNPHAVGGFGDMSDVLQGAGELIALLLLPAAWDLVRRYRRSTGAERQQFRWVVRALLATPVAFFVVTATGEAVLSEEASQLTDLAGIWVLGFGIAGALGVSILRYRLWDIDRIVSRTVAYVLLMLAVVGVYLGSVLSIQTITRPVAGESDLAVAVSTLIAAALFQPLRRRVQAIVDRRFNRSRYDAERTIAAFAGRLRDEVDLTALRTELLETAGSALHPTSCSTWLKGATR